MNIAQFLEHWRIAENPFRGEEARRDPVFARIGFDRAAAEPEPKPGPEVVQAAMPQVPAAPAPAHTSIATHHSEFDKILGDLDRPASSIVFGEKGSGKTAIRLQLTDRISAFNAGLPDRKVLLIPYDDLNGVLDRYCRRMGGKSPQEALAKFRLADHLDAILSQVVPRFVEQVMAPPGRPVAPALGSSAAERLDLGPDPRRLLRKRPMSERRDVLLLQAVYDRPDVAHLRTARLRRMLWLPPMWSELPWMLLEYLGWIPAAAMVWWELSQGHGLTLDSRPGYIIGALVGLWALVLMKRLVWDKLARMRLARRVRRQVRVQGRGDTYYARSIRQLDPALRDGSHLPLNDANEARYAMLARLRGLLRHFGYAGIVVVIDRVDEPTIVSGDADRMKAVVWPLLNNKFLQLEGVGVKMLLPIELRHALFKESSAFFQEARLDKQNMVERLVWTGSLLYELCEARLRACMTPDAPATGLLDLFAEDVTGRDLVDALEQMHQPRDAFKFLYACIAEHCSNVTVDQGQWKIPKATLDTVRKQQSERVQQLHRGIRPA